MQALLGLLIGCLLLTKTVCNVPCVAFACKGATFKALRGWQASGCACAASNTFGCFTGFGGKVRDKALYLKPVEF